MSLKYVILACGNAARFATIISILQFFMLCGVAADAPKDIHFGYWDDHVLIVAKVIDVSKAGDDRWNYKMSVIPIGCMAGTFDCGRYRVLELPLSCDREDTSIKAPPEKDALILFAMTFRKDGTRAVDTHYLDFMYGKSALTPIDSKEIVIKHVNNELRRYYRPDRDSDWPNDYAK